MEKHIIDELDLMLDAQGLPLHLRLAPQYVEDTILLVGDPARVDQVGAFLQEPMLCAENREFRVLRGRFHNMKLCVISTGIGAGCIDIVLNELDALVNVDLSTRKLRPQHRALRLVRLGTCGAVHADVPSGSVMATGMVADFSTLGYYYAYTPSPLQRDCAKQIMQSLSWPAALSAPLCVESSAQLLSVLSPLAHRVGITLSMPGFFAPQGRSVRLPSAFSGWVEKLQRVQWHNQRVENIEMEAGALNLLASLLGHHAITLCVAINNRDTGRAHVDYHAAMNQLIEKTLLALSASC